MDRNVKPNPVTKIGKDGKQKMTTPKHFDQDEMDKLRREFANRLHKLIGDPDGEPNLENFSKATGVPMRILSQLQNTRHINWPSVWNLVRIAVGADVSTDWLLFGEDKRKTKK